MIAILRPWRLAMALMSALFIASVYRAWLVPITMDEAYTYLSFVAPPLSQILTTYSPNHHVLFSLLAKASVQLLGASEFSLRVPALIGGLICFAAIASLSRRLFGDGWLMFLAVCLITLNPLIFDYMSQARGYGLALGFYLFGLLFSAEFVCTTSHRVSRLALIGATLGLSLAANLTFAIPVIALNLLVLPALAESGPKYLVRAVAAMLTAEFTVAGLIAGAPLMHADPRAFVGGYSSLAETLRNLAISCVVHDFEPGWIGTSTLNLWSWLYPLFQWIFLLTLAIVVLLCGEYVRRRIKSRGQPFIGYTRSDQHLYLSGGSLVLIVVLLVAVRAITGAPYPFARMVLYCWPLLAFTICLLMKRFRGGTILRRSAFALYLLFALSMTLQSAMQLRLDHYGWLTYTAGTRQIAEFIRRQQPATGPVHITTSNSLFPSLDFYRAIYSMERWQLTVYSDPLPQTDYLVLDVFDSPKRVPQDFQSRWHDPLSKALIAAPRRHP